MTDRIDRRASLPSDAPPLRIAQLIASRGVGGLERHVVELARGMRRRGESVSVIAPPGAWIADDVETVELPLHRSRRNPLLLWALLRHLRSARYDVVHAQGSKAAHCLASIRPWLSTLTVGTQHNVKRNASSFGRLDVAIAVSQGVARTMLPVVTSVIHHGLGLSTDSTPVSVLPEWRPLCLAVGRLVTAKGFDRLIELWPGMPGTLWIAGDGPERSRLATRIVRLGLEDRVRLLGQIDDIPSLMLAADGVLVPSRREGFSYVVAEALLYGCPVMATDVPVANEVLPDELILPDEPRAMREALLHALTNLPAWRALCAPAIAYARRHFLFDRMVDDTLDLYRRALFARAGSRCANSLIP